MHGGGCPSILYVTVGALAEIEPGSARARLDVESSRTAVRCKCSTGTATVKPKRSDYVTPPLCCASSKMATNGPRICSSSTVRLEDGDKRTNEFADGVHKLLDEQSC
jgi:hypothetical protein